MPTSHSDYRIQKERLRITLTTFGGERIVGDLFVQASARNRYGREEAHDVANSAEPFFPVLSESGETYLVAKDRVREIEVGHDATPAEEWRIGSPSTIELSVTGGGTHTGVIYLEAVTGRSRVLDFLNRVGERFLTLHTSRGAVLINRTAVEHVRPLD
jgi:hypothetical protein